MSKSKLGVLNTMFKKEKLSEGELDEIWKKMTERIQQQS
jgi:hypothetical protein